MYTKRLSEKKYLTLLLLLTGLVSLSLSLGGCSSDGEERPEYLGASSIKDLEVPPTLTSPDTSSAMRLPQPSDKARSGESAAEKAKVVAPVFSGFELKHDSRLYWLEIDMPVVDVWALLPQFLASEGIEVDRIEKLLGFIDTKWMNEYKVTYKSEGDSSGWFSGFSPDFKDRFRIRVEAQGEKKSRLFVSHRGLQISVADDVSEWTSRASEPFLEREIMYRFVLFNGIRKSGATELLASYDSYQPRVQRITDASVYEFDVRGDADTIWLRLQIAMDRMGVDILKHDKASSVMIVKVGNLKAKEKPAEDDSGWFSGLFSGKDIKVDEDEEYESAEYKEKTRNVSPEDRITLQLKQIAGNTSSKIKISNEDGSSAKGELPLVFRDALLEQLK